MRNKKIILLILVTLLFSGCSVQYNLYINSDLSVNESITATENTYQLRTNTGQEPKVAANTLFDVYKIKGIDYNVTTTSNEDNTITKVSTKFDSLEDYEEYFTSDIIKEVKVTQKDKYITLEFEQEVPLTDYTSKSLVYDSVEVNINMPFTVTNHNADTVSGDTYTWYINKNWYINICFYNWYKCFCT